MYFSTKLKKNHLYQYKTKNGFLIRWFISASTTLLLKDRVDVLRKIDSLRCFYPILILQFEQIIFNFVPYTNR